MSEFKALRIGRLLSERPYLQNVIANTMWMFADKIIRMGIGLFVGVWIARYLGPDQYGIWNYAMAFSALFGVLAALGLDRIIVRELVAHPEEHNAILGSAFVLKLMGGITALLITIISIIIVRPGETLTLCLVFLSAAGFIFQSFNVIDFFFQSRVQAKYTTYAAGAAFLLVTLIKIFLLINQAPLVAFAGAGLAEVVFTAIFLMIAYSCNYQSMRTWRFVSSVAWKQLRDSWPLILSSMAIIVYMRIDQIMIGQMLNDHEVGIFSAAVRISEIWYFFPMAVVSSVFPIIVVNRTNDRGLYLQRLQKLLDIMAISGISIALVTSVLSSEIVVMLYGERYAPSADVLAFHVWAGVFVCLGAAGGAWFIAENLQKYTFNRSIAGALTNILLNLYLIPAYGPKGAAVATIISYGCALVFFNALHPATRPIFVYQLKSLFPLRLIFKGVH